MLLLMRLYGHCVPQPSHSSPGLPLAVLPATNAITHRQRATVVNAHRHNWSEVLPDNVLLSTVSTPLCVEDAAAVIECAK